MGPVSEKTYGPVSVAGTDLNRVSVFESHEHAITPSDMMMSPHDDAVERFGPMIDQRSRRASPKRIREAILEAAKSHPELRDVRVEVTASERPTVILWRRLPREGRYIPRTRLDLDSYTGLHASAALLAQETADVWMYRVKPACEGCSAAWPKDTSSRRLGCLERVSTRCTTDEAARLLSDIAEGGGLCLAVGNTAADYMTMDKHLLALGWNYLPDSQRMRKHGASGSIEVRTARAAMGIGSFNALWTHGGGHGYDIARRRAPDADLFIATETGSLGLEGVFLR